MRRCTWPLAFLAALSSCVSTEVEGTVAGQSLDVEESVLCRTLPYCGAWKHSHQCWGIVLSGSQNACFKIEDHGVSSLDGSMSVFFYSRSSPLPLGEYPVLDPEAGGGIPDRFALVALALPDRSSFRGTSGLVALKRFRDDDSAEGTFEVDFAGEGLHGRFEAEACPSHNMTVCVSPVERDPWDPE